MAQVVKAQIPGAFRDLQRGGDEVRYFAYHGGRGSAKSHSVASHLVLTGVKRPLRWLCAREIQKSLTMSSMQVLKDKIVAHGLENAYTATRDGIFGPNGTQFLFAGLRTNPDSVKSMEGLDGAWIEEADRCSQTSLELLTPTIRKDGSQVIFTFNRRNVTDPVDKMFIGGRPPPKSVVKQVNWKDNPFFPSVLYDEMMWLKSRDRDKWLHVWEGNPLSRSEVRVFNNWEIDDLDAVIPKGAVARWGADWGFAIDPTVLVKMYRWGRTLYIAREAYKVKCEIEETPALFAGSDWFDPPRWENRFNHPGVDEVLSGQIVADSARPETISYMRARGFNIKSAIKGARSVEEGVEFVKTLDIVVHPSCTHVLDELALYGYKVDKITDAVLPQLADRDNHVIDAIRYALEGERRQAKGSIAMFSQTVDLEAEDPFYVNPMHGHNGGPEWDPLDN